MLLSFGGQHKGSGPAVVLQIPVVQRVGVGADRILSDGFIGNTLDHVCLQAACFADGSNIRMLSRKVKGRFNRIGGFISFPLEYIQNTFDFAHRL